MNFIVRELPKATDDVNGIFCWLQKRSPAGALSWLDAYDGMIERLKTSAASVGLAPESAQCDVEVRQALFKTARGRTYRALFMIEDDEVFILRVRGPGQAPVKPKDIK
jgi:hypothetical protein